MNILIVDDDLVSRVKLAKILSSYGTCATAEDGPSALCQFGFAFGIGKPFDLVAMDVEMPGMRGQDVVRAIRQWEQKMAVEHPMEYSAAAHSKIVMVTASSDMATVASSYRQLCDDYIVKPVNPDNIQRTLAKLQLI